MSGRRRKKLLGLLLVAAVAVTAALPLVRP